MLQRMSDPKFQEVLKNQRNCAKFNARENPNTITGFSMDRWTDFVTLTKSTILIHLKKQQPQNMSWRKGRGESH